MEDIRNNLLDILKKFQDIENLMNVQNSNGNWNFDPYMRGLANGLIVANSVITGEEPIFKGEPKEGYLVDKNL